MFLIFHVTSPTNCLNGHVTLCLGDLLSASHHAAKFGNLRHCGSRKKTFLICHLISKTHMIKELYDFMRQSPS